ncbi:MAG TPA: recombinase family protein [Acetobacteraceae bacterium]|jgi:hypothetical protein
MDDQAGTDTQARRLPKAGCKCVLHDVASTAKTGHTQIRRLRDQFEAGDVVTVTRIDLLARSTSDLFTIVKQIVDARTQSRTLAEPWSNTGTERLMIAVLIRGRRTWSVALSAAPARRTDQPGEGAGGRPPKLAPLKQNEARRRAAGTTLAELAKRYNVGPVTNSGLSPQQGGRCGTVCA